MFAGLKKWMMDWGGKSSSWPGAPGFWGGALTPGLEGGAMRQRLQAWQPAAVHINALLQAAGPTVQSRVRWLGRNNGYSRAAIRSWTSASVGAGIKPVPSGVEDEDLKEAINAAWYDWDDEADAEGLTTFYGLTRRVSREVYQAGECFVRFRPRFPQDGLSVPLQLQLLPSEQLPIVSPFEVVPDTMGNAGGAIRMGIEFDRNVRDRRVAYWMYRNNPTDQTVTWRELIAADELVRVPADEVIHIFDPQEAGQIRGLSGMHAAMVKFFQLDAYDDAELERQKIQAMFAGFIETPEERDAEDRLISKRPQDEIPALSPGMLTQLFGGEKFTQTAPAGVAGTYEPFQRRVLLALSAALGVPYAELTGDLTQATYASSRAGLLAFRQEVEAFQHSVLIFQFVRRVWERWMDTAVLAGALPITMAAYSANPRMYRRMQAYPPRPPWVDPLKDRQALKLAVDSHLMSLTQAAAQEGYDLADIYADMAAEAELRDRYGIPPPNPGWGSRVVGQAPQPTAEPIPTPTDSSEAA